MYSKRTYGVLFEHYLMVHTTPGATTFPNLSSSFRFAFYAKRGGEEQETEGKESSWGNSARPLPSESGDTEKSLLRKWERYKIPPGQGENLVQKLLPLLCRSLLFFTPLVQQKMLLVGDIFFQVKSPRVRV